MLYWLCISSKTKFSFLNVIKIHGAVSISLLLVKLKYNLCLHKNIYVHVCIHISAASNCFYLLDVDHKGSQLQCSGAEKNTLAHHYLLIRYLMRYRE